MFLFILIHSVDSAKRDKRRVKRVILDNRSVSSKQKKRHLPWDTNYQKKRESKKRKRRREGWE